MVHNISLRARAYCTIAWRHTTVILKVSLLHGLLISLTISREISAALALGLSRAKARGMGGDLPPYLEPLECCRCRGPLSPPDPDDIPIELEHIRSDNSGYDEYFIGVPSDSAEDEPTQENTRLCDTDSQENYVSISRDDENTRLISSADEDESGQENTRLCDTDSDTDDPRSSWTTITRSECFDTE